MLSEKGHQYPDLTLEAPEAVGVTLQGLTNGQSIGRIWYHFAFGIILRFGTLFKWIHLSWTSRWPRRRPSRWRAAPTTLESFHHQQDVCRDSSD